jgi:hypothetical protein
VIKLLIKELLFCKLSHMAGQLRPKGHRQKRITMPVFRQIFSLLIVKVSGLIEGNHAVLSVPDWRVSVQRRLFIPRASSRRSLQECAAIWFCGIDSSWILYGGYFPLYDRATARRQNEVRGREPQSNGLLTYQPALGAVQLEIAS